MNVKRSDHLNSPPASGLLHKQSTVVEAAEIGPPPLMVPQWDAVDQLHPNPLA